MSPLLRPASPVVKGGVSGETDRPVLPSPRTLYKTEREIARAWFEVEAEYEAWSPELGSAPATKARTALAILICQGVAEKFLASTSRRMKVAEAFIEFSMMEVSSGGG
jgi:hypothetical protein